MLRFSCQGSWPCVVQAEDEEMEEAEEADKEEVGGVSRQAGDVGM